jgi:hypothetical protein
LEFPNTADGKDRALILAALFILDFSYFEDDHP